MLALACCVLVLAPSMTAAELIVRTYAHARIDDTRMRSLAGLDSATTLVQQESTRALDNAQLIASERNQAPPADLVQAAADARAAVRATTLVGELDSGGHLLASDPATNLPLGNDGVVKTALGGKPAVGTVNRTPPAIEASAPLASGGAIVVVENIDDTLANSWLRLSGLDAGVVQNVQNTPRIVAASRALRRSVSVAQDTAVNLDLRTFAGDQFQNVQIGTDAFWLASRPLLRANEVTTAVLLVGEPADAVSVPVTQARMWADGAAIGAGLLAGVCGFLLGNVLRARLRRLIAAAREVGRPAAPRTQARMRGIWGEAEHELSQARTRVEEQLGAERFRAGRVEAVLASLAEGVIVADAEREVVLVNPAARALLDGSGLHDSQRVIRSYSAIVRAEESDEPLGTVTVFRDATREQELDRLKSEFLTVVSHELQTPLTAIKGALELVLDDDTGQLTRVQRRFLDTIDRNSSRLISLVGDLLDMSRLEAGRVELNPQPLDTPNVVRGVVGALANLFESRNTQVSLALPESVPPILGDRRRVEQILTNLLANAAKYTPPGGEVEVSASSTESEVSLSVSDNGPGVPEGEREAVFDKFYRGPDALRRSEPGSGLGLAIVKSLVELHGGSVSVENVNGGVGKHGARFVVKLPRAAEEE